MQLPTTPSKFIVLLLYEETTSKYQHERRSEFQKATGLEHGHCSRLQSFSFNHVLTVHMMSSPRTRMARTKRACDGCQIRKVKCDGGQPCLSCANTTIACTFSRTVHTRGPRRMRETTRNIIQRIQREGQRQLSVDDENTGLESKSTDDPAQIVSIRQGSVSACELCGHQCGSLTASIIQDVETNPGRCARTAVVHIPCENVSGMAHCRCGQLDCRTATGGPRQP